MNRFILLPAAVFISVSSLCYSDEDTKKAIREKMIPCTVKISTNSGTGSGVIIYSKSKSATSKVETYIWTDYHVVDDTAVAEKKDGMTIIKILPVTVFTYRYDGRNIVISETLIAYTLWYNKEQDLATLKLQSEKVYPVAEFADLNEISVIDECYAVGCPTGENPTVTAGMIQQIDQSIMGINCWRISADIFFGDSDGGVWTKSGKLVGLVDMVRTYKGQAITHIGFIIPSSNLEKWIVEINQKFILRIEESVPLLGVK